MGDMSVVADDVVDVLAALVTAAIPVLRSRIPPVPAAELGRTAAPPPASPMRRSSWSAPLLAERLLGALELTIPELDMTGAPDLSPYLPAPGRPRRNGPAATAVSSGHGQAMAAATLLDQFRPGTSELVTALSRRLSAHPTVAPLLAVGPEAATEETIAADRGAACLALAVAVALIAAGDDSAIRGPGFSREAAAVGLGVGAARALLSEVPMPEPYTALVLARERAKFQLPRGATGRIAVAGPRSSVPVTPMTEGCRVGCAR